MISTDGIHLQYLNVRLIRIRLNADIDLDIPNGHQGLEKYCASLGHKANHSFVPNAEWALVEVGYKILEIKANHPNHPCRTGTYLSLSQTASKVWTDTWFGQPRAHQEG